MIWLQERKEFDETKAGVKGLVDQALSWRDTFAFHFAPNNAPKPEDLPVVCRDILLEYGEHIDKWIDVRPIPGALVVNIGDGLQLVTNDSSVHGLVGITRNVGTML
ncbi:hypothetical protein P8452_02125 [Trifolium repens]|nr:hypothetical protein P8452_02125 [Trifolium repens]